MSIVNCPHCREQVSIPFEASGEALVQCPLCQEEYRLDTALQQLPPVLIVIDDPRATVGADEDDEGMAFAPLTGLGIERDDADEYATDKKAPAFQFESGSAPAAAAAPRVRGSRPSHRSSSPARQVVQIVAGGVAGVIIAQLILWWGPFDLSVGNRDLTGFGRKYGRYIPFLVPSSIRGEGDPSGDGEDAPAESELPDTQKFAAANEPDPDSEIPDFPYAEPHLQRPGGVPDVGNAEGSGEPNPKKRGGRKANGQPDDAPPTAEDGDASATDGGSGLPDGQPASKESSNDVLDADMEVDVPSLDLDSPLDKSPLDIPVPSVGLPAMEPAPAEVKAGLRNAPRVDGGDLVQRFSEALSANIALDTAEAPDGGQKRTLAIEFYRSLASLGEVLTFVDRSDEAVVERIADVDELLLTVAKQADKLGIVGVATPSWMDNARPNDGVVLFGTVQAISKRGPYHETRMKLKSQDEREVIIVSLDDPGADYAEGDLVVLLGTIVEQPAKRLGAYTGGATSVVLGGRHYRLQP